ncbi:uncharacterized protein LOC105354256 isoform X1 [Oryzias latipes]|uniref:uncharacterized protein LOC105354256 isoform X1 n=2 Tax=Oryzias latipes TaxID=8090 RepID=UPI0005CBA669|nr:uncharacterized protein LOC105354256 isoform X1 [Oryzias latipes]
MKNEERSSHERNAELLLMMMMDFTTLGLIWFVLALPPTSQELVKLKVSPTVVAKINTQVSLHCNASSSQKGLVIKHMGWTQNTKLCSVNVEERVIIHQNNFTSPFHCEYEDGRLSLVFQRLLPLEINQQFMCKLRSNQGVVHEFTTVELQESGEAADGSFQHKSPRCIFDHVYPDGDVHWFHGGRNLSDASEKSHTSKSVDPQGWLTITSQLPVHSGQESRLPYNCSLKSTLSGRYIASIALVGNGGTPWRSSAESEIIKAALCLCVSLILSWK